MVKNLVSCWPGASVESRIPGPEVQPGLVHCSCRASARCSHTNDSDQPLRAPVGQKPSIGPREAGAPVSQEGLVGLERASDGRPQTAPALGRPLPGTGAGDLGQEQSGQHPIPPAGILSRCLGPRWCPECHGHGRCSHHTELDAETPGVGPGWPPRGYTPARVSPRGKPCLAGWGQTETQGPVGTGRTLQSQGTWQ